VVESVPCCNVVVNRWQATAYDQFSSMSHDDVARYKLGTRRPAVKEASISSQTSKLIQMRSSDEDVDQEFDARRRWSRQIRLPADQRECAASWIHSAAGLYFIDLLYYIG